MRDFAAVEPVPSHLEQLRKIDRPDRLTVVPVALAEAEGEVSFALDGQASRFADGVADLSVRQTRGERLIAEGVPSPDVFKLDVEGAEGHALNGLQSALPGVRAALIEVHFGILTRGPLSRAAADPRAAPRPLLRASLGRPVAPAGQPVTP